MKMLLKLFERSSRYGLFALAVVAIFFCVHCKRDSNVTFLIQNLHPQLTNVDIRVSFKPRSGPELRLWSTAIPYNGNSKAIYSKKLQLTPAIPADVHCCLRVVLAYKDE